MTAAKHAWKQDAAQPDRIAGHYANEGFQKKHQY